mgnify:CR=1 FL=1
MLLLFCNPDPKLPLFYLFISEFDLFYAFLLPSSGPLFKICWSFSPDGDGVNDVFYVYGKDIVEFDLLIIDRWGEELFYTKDMDEGWDGFYRGTLSKVETYVWKIKYKDIQGNPGEQIGTVSLIR